MDVTLADPLVGAVLDGRYRIRGRIARGGMATVYDAMDERLERVVAVKVMHPTYASDPLFIDRFIREAKAAARLSHPNVVAVFDQGSHDELAFLVMEQVPGRTLRDVLADRGRLSVAEAVTVMESVLDALAAAHRSGLVHRDIKPENVLIGVDGAVKVADFGLARAVETSSHTVTGNVVMGTVAYVSPEQIISGHADTRSDVYSAGVMLFEMLTGSVPFSGDSAVNIAFQHVNRSVPPPSTRLGEIPPALDELTVRATRREPGARPADAGAFLAELKFVRSDVGLPHVVVSAPPLQADSPAAQATRAVAPPFAPRTQVQQQVRGPRGLTLPPQRARRPHSGLIAIVILVILGLIAAGTGWWFGAGRWTEAPSLLKLSQQQAKSKAAEQGLEVKLGPARHSEVVTQGQVILQDPAPNDRVREGGVITLILSLGPERIPVPGVAGLQQSEAEAALTERNLKFTVKPTFDPRVVNGTAVGTEPKEGTALAPGTVVTLLVSQGAKPVDLRDLRGYSRAEAEQLLTGLGLVPDVSERNTDEDDERGRVLAQDPGPGQVQAGSKVKLTVGSGDARVTVPDLSGTSFNEARKELQKVGLEIRRVGKGNKVLFQLPVAGSEVDAGSRVSVWFTR